MANATAKQIQAELDRRQFAKQILVNRLGRGIDIFFSDWKTQVDTNDRMYRGDWTIDWPDGTTEGAKPVVMNLSQVATDDFGRLVMEVQPQIRCASRGDEHTNQKRAYKKEAILQTYAAVNDIEEENHWLALDLAQTGIALEAITYDEPEEGEDNFPVFTRIDPRGAFPRFVNNKLVDLIVVQRMEKELVSPAYDIDLSDYFEGDQLGRTTEVEVIDYYDANSYSRVLVLLAASGNAPAVKMGKAKADKDSPAALISTWQHNLKKPCVTWARLKTADGAFRGFFDQLKGATLTQNRILNLIITGAEQIVYAPFVEYDIDNPNDPPGPKTVFHARTKDGRMIRVPNGGANPEVFHVLEYLEAQARAGGNYPQSRQGEIGQSIASASFVNSTMGNLTTMIKSGQKEIGRLWQRRNRLALQIDKTFCTQGSKTLAIPSGKFSTYDPQKDIDNYDNMVIYGAGAGLDALNKKAALANDVNLGIASKKTAREQTEYLLDEEGEAQQIAREKTEDALLQRLLTDPNTGMAMIMHFAQLLQTGMDPLDAAAVLASAAEDQQAQQLAAQQAAAGQGSASGPSAPGTPMTPPVGMNTPPASPEAPVRSAALPQPSQARRLPSMESMVAAG